MTEAENPVTRIPIGPSIEILFVGNDDDAACINDFFNFSIQLYKPQECKEWFLKKGTRR